MNAPARKWIVGLDLRKSSQGAIRYAAWFSRTSSTEEHLIGLHVLEEAQLQAALRYHHLEELRKGAKEAAETVLERVGAADKLTDLHIVEGTTAENDLESARQYHRADGIIVGRQAKREGRHVLRLGRVARRILRMLPSPVIVVPPDLETDQIGDGPVAVSVNLHEDCIAAATFAADMAQRLGRKLLLVHVVPLPEDYGAAYIPEASLQKLRIEHQTTGETELEAWAKEQGLESADRLVLQGGLIEHLLEAAEQHQACLLVTGSRRLSGLERMLLTSICSELASRAPCAVAVVPPAA
jgi:nucleotide-binding universal stress UspA family protein